MPHRTGAGIALLADLTRRRIIAALATKPRRPSQLATELALSPPAIARQLRLLEDAGLVMRHEVPGDGRGVLYTINHWRHGAITAWLAGTGVGLPEPEVGRVGPEVGVVRPEARTDLKGIRRPARPFGDR